MADTQVEFAADYRHRVDAAAVKVYPAGWSGQVPAELATAARKAGALAETGGGETTPARPRKLADLTVRELEAVAAALPEPVDLSDAKTKNDKLAAFEAAGYDRGVAAAWPGLEAEEAS